MMAWMYKKTRELRHERRMKQSKRIEMMMDERLTKKEKA
jgi:hypothetical protein